MKENCALADFLPMSEPEWRALHEPHGKPSKEYNPIQPPKGAGYRLFKLFCSCGSILVSMEDE